MARPKGSPKLSGRTKGTVNKTSATARESVACFVEGNVDRLNGWLEDIAQGIPDEVVETVDDDGNKKQTVTKWLIKPDPKAAYDSLMSVVEYHIPKLARTEQQFLDKDGRPADASVTVRYVE